MYKCGQVLAHQRIQLNYVLIPHGVLTQEIKFNLVSRKHFNMFYSKTAASLGIGLILVFLITYSQS